MLKYETYKTLAEGSMESLECEVVASAGADPCHRESLEFSQGEGN